MSQELPPAADDLGPAEDAGDAPHTDTLTDLLDRIAREAFRRSLAHREPPDPPVL